MSNQFEVRADNIKDVYLDNAVKIRYFDAYLELCENLNPLFEYTEPVHINHPDEADSQFKNNRGKPYRLDILGFKINSTLDGIPSCSVALPAGKLIADLALEGTTFVKQGEYRHEPILDKKTYEDVLMDGSGNGESLEQRYRACIVWYRERFVDTDIEDDARNAFKPVFKGVISADVFTRVAHQQENVEVKINHWIYLLDTMIMRNTFMSTQSMYSTYTPWLRQRDPSMSGQSEGANSQSHSQFLLELLAQPERTIDLQEEIYKYFISEVELSFKGYSRMFTELEASGSTGEALQTIVENNQNLVHNLFRYVLERYEKNRQEQYAQNKPELNLTGAKRTSEPTLEGGVNCLTANHPAIAFYTALYEMEAGDINGITYFQALSHLARQFELRLVCTTNSIGLEAIRCRTRNWALPPIDFCTAVYNTTTYARTPAVTVVATEYSHRKQGDSFEYFKRDPNASGAIGWAAAYVDPQVKPQDKHSLGTIGIVTAPKWYSNVYDANTLRRWLQPAGQLNEVIADTSDGNSDNGEKELEIITSELEKTLAGLAKMYHYHAKTLGKNVIAVMPFNINVMTGMPVCVKDSTTGIYHSGIIANFTHTLNQAALVAQTNITLAYTDTFRHDINSEYDRVYARGGAEYHWMKNQIPPDQEPKENPLSEGNEQDNENPMFPQSPAFVGRPIYT